MKLIHISDLHLGKRFHNYSMIEEQKYILQEILRVVDREEAEAVLIAGDVYDKSVPPAEAVSLFDDFLVELAERDLSVFVISGNHDSPERIAFASRLIAHSGVYISPVYRGQVAPVVLTDTYGEIAFYLLPFVKPVHVRHFYSEEKIENYTDAVRCVLANMDIDTGRRNVLVAHQFVTGASGSGSEDLMIGGLDAMEADVFDIFDYTALGHIHRAQKVGKGNVYYSGSLLKYSFSEVGQEKSLSVIELKKKGELLIHKVPLVPRRNVSEYRGSYRELIDRGRSTEVETNDFVKLILTDEQEIPNAFYQLRTVYPNILQMEYDNKRTQGLQGEYKPEAAEELLPEELFSMFYEQMNHQPLEEGQRQYIKKIIGEIWDGGNE